MATILLSIKPEYAEKILEGTKKFEYRRIIPKQNVDKIIIYESAPVSKVVGEVEVLGIYQGSAPNPAKCIWYETTNDKTYQNPKAEELAGILFKDLEKYYGVKYGPAYAYDLGEVTKYSKLKDLSEFGIKTAPQNFVYLDNLSEW